MSWIVSLPCTRDEAEALSGEIPELDVLPDAPVVVTREIDEDADAWQLDAYVDDKPAPALLKLLQALIPSAKGKKPSVSELPEEDWVTLSQQGLEPVQAGRFFVQPAAFRAVTGADRRTFPAGQRFFHLPSSITRQMPYS